MNTAGVRIVDSSMSKKPTPTRPPPPGVGMDIQIQKISYPSTTGGGGTAFKDNCGNVVVVMDNSVEMKTPAIGRGSVGGGGAFTTQESNGSNKMKHEFFLSDEKLKNEQIRLEKLKEIVAEVLTKRECMVTDEEKDRIESSILNHCSVLMPWINRDKLRDHVRNLEAQFSETIPTTSVGSYEKKSDTIVERKNDFTTTTTTASDEKMEDSKMPSVDLDATNVTLSESTEIEVEDAPVLTQQHRMIRLKKLKELAAEVVQRKARGERYGIESSILKKYSVIMPWITRDKLRHHVRFLENRLIRDQENNTTRDSLESGSCEMRALSPETTNDTSEEDPKEKEVSVITAEMPPGMPPSDIKLGMKMTEEVLLNHAQKELRLKKLKELAKEVVRRKVSLQTRKGRYGVLASVLRHYSQHMPWITRDKLRYHVRHLEAQLIAGNTDLLESLQQSGGNDIPPPFDDIELKAENHDFLVSEEGNEETNGLMDDVKETKMPEIDTALNDSESTSASGDTNRIKDAKEILLQKEFRLEKLKEIANEVVRRKRTCAHLCKGTYGIESSILKYYSEHMPWITRDKLRYHVRRTEALLGDTHDAPKIIENEDVKRESTINNVEMNRKNNEMGQPKEISVASVDKGSASSDVQNGVGEFPKSSLDSSLSLDGVSMNAVVTKGDALYAVIMNAVTEIADEHRKKHKVEALERGYLDRIIEEQREKYNLGKDFKINKETIRSRLKRRRTIRSYPKEKLPMEDVEDTIMTLLVQRRKLDKPFTMSEGLSMANALIKNTRIEREMIDYKKKRKICETEGSEYEKEVLGPWYWLDFLNRKKPALGGEVFET